MPVPSFTAHADRDGTSPVAVMQNPAESNGVDPALLHMHKAKHVIFFLTD